MIVPGAWDCRKMATAVVACKPGLSLQRAVYPTVSDACFIEGLLALHCEREINVLVISWAIRTEGFCCILPRLRKKEMVVTSKPPFVAPRLCWVISAVHRPRRHPRTVRIVSAYAEHGLRFPHGKTIPYQEWRTQKVMRLGQHPKFIAAS